VVVENERYKRHVNIERDIARRDIAAHDFVVASRMVAVAGLRLANAARSNQLALAAAGQTRLVLTRTLMPVMVVTDMIVWDT